MSTGTAAPDTQAAIDADALRRKYGEGERHYVVKSRKD